MPPLQDRRICRKFQEALAAKSQCMGKNKQLEVPVEIWEAGSKSVFSRQYRTAHCHFVCFRNDISRCWQTWFLAIFSLLTNLTCFICLREATWFKIFGQNTPRQLLPCTQTQTFVSPVAWRVSQVHIFRRPQSEKRCFLQSNSRHLSDCLLQWHICLVDFQMWISFTYYLLQIYIHYSHTRTRAQARDTTAAAKIEIPWVHTIMGTCSVISGREISQFLTFRLLIHLPTFPDHKESQRLSDCPRFWRNLPRSPAPRINFRSRSTVSASTWQEKAIGPSLSLAPKNRVTQTKPPWDCALWN